MTPPLTIEQIEDAISRSDRAFQQRLLKDLPRLLSIQASNSALLKIAEPSFEFWNNPEDEAYDRL